MIAWTRDRVTRFGYSTLEATSAPISGIGLLLVAAGLVFLALCALGLRRASRRTGLIFLVVGAAPLTAGRAIGWDPYFVGRNEPGRRRRSTHMNYAVGLLPIAVVTAALLLLLARRWPERQVFANAVVILGLLAMLTYCWYLSVPPGGR